MHNINIIQKNLRVPIQDFGFLVSTDKYYVSYLKTSTLFCYRPPVNRMISFSNNRLKSLIYKEALFNWDGMENYRAKKTDLIFSIRMRGKFTSVAWKLWFVARLNRTCTYINAGTPSHMTLPHLIKCACFHDNRFQNTQL